MSRTDATKDSHDAVSEASDTDDRRFGAAGRWLIGLEDVVRASYAKRHFEGGGLTRIQQDTDSFVAELNYPTLTVDHFVADGVSVGASASYWTVASDDENVMTSPDGTTQSAPSTTKRHDVALGPRVGLALSVADRLDLWGRLAVLGHLGYETGSSLSSLSGQRDTASTSTSLGAEASVLFAYSPGDFITMLAGGGLSQELISHLDSTFDRRTERLSQLPVPFVTAGLGVRL